MIITFSNKSRALLSLSSSLAQKLAMLLVSPVAACCAASVARDMLAIVTMRPRRASLSTSHMPEGWRNLSESTLRRPAGLAHLPCAAIAAGSRLLHQPTLTDRTPVRQGMRRWRCRTPMSSSSSRRTSRPRRNGWSRSGHGQEENRPVLRKNAEFDMQKLDKINHWINQIYKDGRRTW